LKSEKNVKYVFSNTDPGALFMPGGYRESSDPSNDEDVMTVTELAMARLNRVVGQNYVLTDDGMVAIAAVSSLSVVSHVYKIAAGTYSRAFLLPHPL